MITRTGASPGGHLLRVVAFATIVTLAGTARAAPRERDAHRVQPLDNGRPAERDWEEIRARTAELAGAMERARMATAPHLFSGELDSRVRRARELSGPSRSGLGRLAFPSAPDDARRRRLAEAGALLDDLQRKMQADVAEGRRFLLALEERGRPAVRLAAAAKRAQLGAREAEAARLARQAAEGLRLAAGGFISRARLWGRQLALSDGPTALADLERRLHAWGAAGEAAILGADLSYIEGALRPGPLPSASVTPAYLSGPAVGPTLEDTTHGREVQLAPEIVARAQELRTALAAYEFVKDEFRLEWYFGSLKGSTETLRERRGNDADLSDVARGAAPSAGDSGAVRPWNGGALHPAHRRGHGVARRR